MRVFNNYFFVLLGSILFQACIKKDVASEFVKTKVMNQVKYELHYIPKSVFDSPSDSLESADLSYYKLILSEEINTGRISELFRQSSYNKLLFYINKQMSLDITGEYDDGIEVHPVQVYFESNNRLANKLVFMIAFEPLKKTQKTFSFVFNDNIFNNGPIKLQYSLKDLKQL